MLGGIVGQHTERIQISLSKIEGFIQNRSGIHFGSICLLTKVNKLT